MYIRFPLNILGDLEIDPVMLQPFLKPLTMLNLVRLVRVNMEDYVHAALIQSSLTSWGSGLPWNTITLASFGWPVRQWYL